MYSHLNRVWNLSKLKIHVHKTHLRFSHSHFNRVQQSSKVKKYKFLNITWDYQVYSHLNRVWKLSKVNILVRKNHLRFSQYYVSRVQKFTKVKEDRSSLKSREILKFILIWIVYGIFSNLKIQVHKTHLRFSHSDVNGVQNSGNVKKYKFLKLTLDSHLNQV